MSSFYGGGGVDRHAQGDPIGGDLGRASGSFAGTSRVRTSRPTLPASTFHGSQSAANPPPLPFPAGCLLSEGELYAFNETMDGRYPSDGMEYA